MALWLVGGSLPAPTPDLQVEAVNASGAALPELADAVGRALVAGGARVVLTGPTAAPCEFCAKIKVTEGASGVLRLEVRDDNRVSSTSLSLPVASALFDRARAIAIHARLLLTSQSRPPAKETARRHQSDAKAAAAPIAKPDAEPDDHEPDVLAADLAEADAAASEQAVAPASEAPAVVQAPPAPAPGVALHRPAPPARRLWPWIPTAIGAAAALGAGACALYAWNRYSSLSDRAQSYDSARSLKSSGESWQRASLVLSGVAVLGLGVGLVALTSASAAQGSTLTAGASPVPGGGVATVAGRWP